MILKLTVLMVTSLFIQVKCGTYVFEKDSADYNKTTIRRQTNHIYGPTQQIVNVDEQHPRGWTGNILEGDHSPIIISEKAPVTINFRTRPRDPRPANEPYGPGRYASPIVFTSQGKVTVNYDSGDASIAPASSSTRTPSLNDNKDICLLTKTVVILPSGAVMPYLKFKTICPYLPEEQKSDIRVVLDNENMSYGQFQETLARKGCSDLGDTRPPPSESDTHQNNGYVAIANGTEVTLDDYRTILSSIVNGSETLTVPNVFRGNYSSCRSLLLYRLPELIPSAFVITPANTIVPFSLYYGVEKQHFNKLPPDSRNTTVEVVNEAGKPVDVQTVRDVIVALKTPKKIYYVFPNGTRLPLVPDDRVPESSESYNCDPDKVKVDIGQRENVPVPIFNGVFAAVNSSDVGDAGDGGTYDGCIMIPSNDYKHKTPWIGTAQTATTRPSDVIKDLNEPKNNVTAYAGNSTSAVLDNVKNNDQTEIVITPINTVNITNNCSSTDKTNGDLPTPNNETTKPIVAVIGTNLNDTKSVTDQNNDSKLNTGYNNETQNVVNIDKTIPEIRNTLQDTPNRTVTIITKYNNSKTHNLTDEKPNVDNNNTITKPDNITISIPGPTEMTNKNINCSNSDIQNFEISYPSSNNNPNTSVTTVNTANDSNVTTNGSNFEHNKYPNKGNDNIETIKTSYTVPITNSSLGSTNNTESISNANENLKPNNNQTTINTESKNTAQVTPDCTETLSTYDNNSKIHNPADEKPNVDNSNTTTKPDSIIISIPGPTEMTNKKINCSNSDIQNFEIPYPSSNNNPKASGTTINSMNNLQVTANGSNSKHTKGNDNIETIKTFNAVPITNSSLGSTNNTDSISNNQTTINKESKNTTQVTPDCTEMLSTYDNNSKIHNLTDEKPNEDNTTTKPKNTTTFTPADITDINEILNPNTNSNIHHTQNNSDILTPNYTNNTVLLIINNNSKSNEALGKANDNVETIKTFNMTSNTNRSLETTINNNPTIAEIIIAKTKENPTGNYNLNLTTDNTNRTIATPKTLNLILKSRTENNVKNFPINYNKVEMANNTNAEYIISPNYTETIITPNNKSINISGAKTIKIILY